MAQLTLFDSTDTVLVDDERGRITYTPRFVDAEGSARLLWLHERKILPGRRFRTRL